MLKESEKQKIIREEEINLSSRRAEIQMVLLPVLIIGFIFTVVWVIISKSTGPFNAIVAVIFGMAVIVLMFYMLKKLHTATLKGHQLLFKNVFSPAYSIDILDVTESKTFRLKSARYLIIKFNQSGINKSVWIMKPGIFSQTSDVELILRVAHDYQYRKRLAEVSGKVSGNNPG